MVFITVRDVNVETRVSVWEYTLPGNYRVLAGKSDKDNDLLSLKVANPNDWWFHVRSLAGSHVVLRVDRDFSVISKVLYQSAAIAAYHSKARGGGFVFVSGTLAKYVTKPTGCKAGTVRIAKEQVFKVKPLIP